MKKLRAKEVAAMLDDDSDWIDSDEEAERDEKREASYDYDSGEEEHEGLEGFLDYIEEYKVFFRLCNTKAFSWGHYNYNKLHKISPIADHLSCKLYTNKICLRNV